MTLRHISSALIFSVALSPLMLSQLGAANGADQDVQRAHAQHSAQTHYLLDLVATIEKPTPVLRQGAPVFQEGDEQIGVIRDVLVHRGKVKTVIELDTRTQEPGGQFFVVPASAYTTETGHAVLAERLNP